ncbi:bi-domain-containing oxidoreductase [Taibaiella soli]|uniref:Dehydrogenase n=1 Tax=Taibaiella soli TaxID=1649169 RepID=A0A2W2B2E3_9BACT|nr:bi-domain-containing oxidoreductase [Taibaiella soli]PZF74198.1 dehydrogenase [Taibaiella soli]
MYQIIQDLKNGDTTLETVPAPAIQDGEVLIRTTYTLVSLGTERMLVAFGKAGWIEKARQQPERVKMVLDKIKTDGLKSTFNAVNNKLNQPLPLGYCNAGIVIGIGKNVSGFQIGDRVASNGAHAEVVSVPQNLVAKVPDSVSDEAAAFTVAGAIALQSIRLVQPSLGETVVVTGLGLIGQITAQLLKANGCRVIGIDIDEVKLTLARNAGIEAVHADSAAAAVYTATNQYGADAVIITATTQSNEVISQAANMCRKRGRIVLTGVIGLELNRADFYEKELSFQVSCSYGPGRYDLQYEEKGSDYPIGYVRWTAKRNFEAVLQAIASGQLDVRPLITKRVPLTNYKDIYDHLSDNQVIAALMEYPEMVNRAASIQLQTHDFSGSNTVLGLIGAGNFTSSFVLPELKKNGAQIKTIASANGLSAAILAKKFEIPTVTSDYRSILNDDQVAAVFITTRHHQHATMVSEVLLAGKDVFVEKPLAINESELNEVITAYQQSKKTLNVGFNRRFAPLAQKMKQLISGSENIPSNIIVTVNAGSIPHNNWLQDMALGGGRIIGEACHFVDLCTFLSGSYVQAVCMNAMGPEKNITSDNVTLLLQYANGTNATIHFFANGSKAYDKERVEVYNQGRTLVLENWKKLTGYGFKGFSSVSGSQNKGHAAQFQLLLNRFKNGGPALIPFDSLINTTQACIAALQSLTEARWIPISDH